MRAQIPKHKVIVSAIAGQLVPLGLESISQGLGILDHVLRVYFEIVRRGLEKLHSEAPDLVVVRSTLQGRENSHVNPLLDIGKLVHVLEEDHTRTRAAKRFVGGRRDHITMGKGRW